METLLRVGLGNAVAATVLALAAAAVSRWGRRPALTHGLWLLVLLKLVTPPLWPVPVPWPAGDDAALAASDDFPPALPVALPTPDSLVPAEPGIEDAKLVAPADWMLPADNIPPAPTALPRPTAPPAARSWVPIVGIVWLLGSLAWWGVALVRVRGFARLLRYARPAPESVQKQAQELARRLGLRRCPPVYRIKAAVSPLLLALAGPPRLILPAALWDRLTAAQRETLLLHELAHLRRRDHWVRRLELLSVGLYWWLPVAWWAQRALQEAEEECCDAWVVNELPGAARDYATALVETVAFLSETRQPLPAGASGAGQLPLLKRRLTMIVQGTTPKGLSRTGLGALLAAGALLLPLLPTVGRGEPPAAKAAKAKPEDAVKQAELEKARAEVKLLKAQLAVKQAQMQAIQKRLDQAQARLTKLEPPKRVDAIFVLPALANPTHIRLVTPNPTNIRFVTPPIPTNIRWNPPVLFDSAKPYNIPADRLRVNVFNYSLKNPPSPEQRLAQLEKKLNAIVQEMAALRKELGGKTSPRK